jgi:CHAT domain-containing protein
MILILSKALKISASLIFFLFPCIALFAIEQNIGINITSNSDLYCSAKSHYENGLYYKSLSELQTHINQLKKNEEIYSAKIAESYLLMADIYDQLSIIDKFEECLNMFEFYNTKTDNNDSLSNAILYAYKSRYYSLRMIPAKAYSYSIKSIEYLPTKKTPIGSEYVVKVLINHMLALRNHTSDLNEKIQLRNRILGEIESLNIPYVPSISFYTITAHMFELDLANNHYTSNLNSINELSKNEYASSLIEKLTVEIERIEHFSGATHPLSARINSLIGLLYFYQNNLEKALHYFDKSIEMLSTGYNVNNKLLSPHSSFLLTIYTKKLNILQTQFLQRNNIHYLNKCLKLIPELEEIWDLYSSVRIDYDHFFNEHNYYSNPYGSILNVYYSLYNITKENKYKQKIFESGVFAKHYSYMHLSKKINNSRQELFDQFVFLDKRKENTAYSESVPSSENPFNEKEKKKSIQLSELKHQLKKDEAILVYTNVKEENQNKLIIQLIEKEKDTVFSLNLDVLNLFITDSLMYHFNSALIDNNAIEFEKQSHKLYSLFMESIQAHISKHIQTLKIYRDPVMENASLPFELLVKTKTKSDNFKTLSYLVNQYNINYMLDYESRKASKQKLVVFLGSNPALSQLIYVDAFVKKLQKKYDVGIYNADKCTKNNLIQKLQSEDIVLIVSHGEGNQHETENDKGIYLTDGLFTISDIKKLKSNSSLVVLLGCRTGLGYTSNEGNINLSRALVQSGVKSTVYADWDIDEKISLELMQRFFDALQKGHSKSKSIALAMNDLKESLSVRLNNPYYWGALRVYGDNSSVQIEEKTKINYILLTILILFLLLFLFFMDKQ